MISIVDNIVTIMPPKIYKNILDKHNMLYIPEIQNIIFTYVGWNNIYLDKQIKYYNRKLGTEFIQRYIEPDYNSSHELLIIKLIYFF